MIQKASVFVLIAITGMFLLAFAGLGGLIFNVSFSLPVMLGIALAFLHAGIFGFFLTDKEVIKSENSS